MYVLYLEMYREWACENGACEIIGLYDNRFDALDKLEKALIMEEEEQRILGISESVKDFITQEKIYNGSGDTYVDVYSSLDSYNDGFNEGCYVIKKVEVHK